VPGEDDKRYLKAAAECLELARAAKDERNQADLVALAQMWLDLADYRVDKPSLLKVLEAFNDWQLQLKKR
jgi:hypothetical protein